MILMKNEEEEYKEGFYPYEPWDILGDRDDE